MELTPLSYLNQNHDFVPCPDCNTDNRYRCKSCFGTGKLCPLCFNNGTKIGIENKLIYCNCGMKNQKSLYFEFLSLNYQQLINIPMEFSGQTADLEEILGKLTKSNYKHITKQEYIYSRFVMTYTREERFFVARYKYLKNLKNSENLRGFIYVNVFQFNDSEYLDAINGILKQNNTAVIIYIGISNNLSPITFPYMTHISKNMRHPAIFFATPEWYDANKFLHTLWIDKSVDKEKHDS